MKIVSFCLIFLSFLSLGAKSLNQAALEKIGKNRDKLNYSIVVLGDSRNRKIVPAGKIGVGDSVLSVIINSVNKISPLPLFAIHGGDLSLVGKKFELERYAEIVKKSRVPWLSVRGNHELYSDSSAIYYNQIVGDTDYSFDIGKIRYIVVASCHPKHVKNRNYSDYYISRGEIIWLDSLLNDAKENGMEPIIFSHVPPCLPPDYTWHCLGDKRSYPKPNIEKSNVKTFLSMLRYYSVHLVIFSHIHHYDSLVKNGITYIITGGAGAPRYKEFKRGIPVYHFIKADVYGRDSLICKVYSPSGKRIDSIPPVKVSFSSKIIPPSLKFKRLKNKNKMEFRFYSPLVRRIKLMNRHGKIIIDTTLIKDKLLLNVNGFSSYKYIIQTGNKIIKGSFFNW